MTAWILAGESEIYKLWKTGLDTVCLPASAAWHIEVRIGMKLEMGERWYFGCSDAPSLGQKLWTEEGLR
jgi:hypothetical protein